ncbi:MAG: peptidoglycan-binding domain-containing protein [Pseudomonadota bacterium]
MLPTQTRALVAVTSLALAAGCSNLTDNTTAVSSGEDMVSVEKLRASENRVTELESRLAATNRDLTSAQQRLAATDTVQTGVGDTSLFPPNPKPGQCYARVLIPAVYKTVSERALKKEAGERIEIVPARFETVEETVLVKEASTRLEVVPAVYSKVQERVMIKPASKKIVEVPAVYESVSERIIDKPAHTAWKKGPATAQSATVISQSTTDTGEIMCLVEVPASYKVVNKRVLVSPARTETVEIPAEYDTVTKTVVSSPATTREVVIPAEYETVSVTRIAQPASQRRIEIPAEYQTLTRTTKTAEERMEWRQVMCEVNMTRDTVVALQKALAAKGFYKAPVDGIIGQQTLGAARSYALQQKLPAGSNYIATEVVDSLGLKL